MLQVPLGIKLHLSISQFDCFDVPHAAITHFNFISVDYLVNPKTAGGQFDRPPVVFRKIYLLKKG